MSKSTLILATTAICLIWISSISGQSLEKLCKQVFTDCQACVVYENECRRPAKPTQRPQRPQPQPTHAPQTPAPTWPPQPQPQPTYPDSPDPAPIPTNPPHNCVQYGQWCNDDKDCCTKNCQLELVTLGKPNQHYTQSVCR